MRLTYGQAKATIAKVLGMCATDSRVMDYTNEATQRLLYKGKWVGTYAHYALCTNGNNSDSNITWPRFLETIESFSICSKPGVIRNQWYEYLSSGPGLLNQNNNIGTSLVDRGEACLISDILTTGNIKKIKVISDYAESGSSAIILQGLDWSGNPIRTSSGTVLGESVPIAVGGNVSINQFSRLDAVIKPVTNGPIRLYEYDTVALTTRQIAFYEPNETLPSYRRSIIPGLQNMSSCDASDSACGTSSRP